MTKHSVFDAYLLKHIVWVLILKVFAIWLLWFLYFSEPKTEKMRLPTETVQERILH